MINIKDHKTGHLWDTYGTLGNIWVKNVESSWMSLGPEHSGRIFYINYLLML